ncbi:PRC-barrel domain protein [Sporotomaculum syntrophicum]|uniref:PRC-barrel domain protein n=1 Tax=Sporotomaculum syntrophicum TaxID=182264 RepID=A0A9D2WRZ7_9FIRM|nr:PRC-barrel domain-containing protein [Sporotomaculum syntrophicum]KAF1085836.1 PRC-barrel domain protein [Sporotomaculum syntrophicum]
MRKSRHFTSMPVISLEEGQQIGIIKGLVVNPSLKRVAALIIEQKGWFNEQKFIPFSNVHSVGEDAVTVKHGTIVQKGGNLPEIISLTKSKVKISGARIVTESGTLLGEADDYYVNLATGEIIGLEFSGSFINSLFSGKAFLDINHVVTIGKNMIVCSDQALVEAVKLDGGLQEKLRGVKDSTSSLWESTIQKTRELGSNVNNSITKVKRNKKQAGETIPPVVEPSAKSKEQVEPVEPAKQEELEKQTEKNNPLNKD